MKWHKLDGLVWVCAVTSALQFGSIVGAVSALVGFLGGAWVGAIAGVQTALLIGLHRRPWDGQLALCITVAGIVSGVIAGCFGQLVGGGFGGALLGLIAGELGAILTVFVGLILANKLGWGYTDCSDALHRYPTRKTPETRT